MLSRLEAISSSKSIYYLIIGALRHLGYEIFIMNALREFTEAEPSKNEPDGNAEDDLNCFHNFIF